MAPYGFTAEQLRELRYASLLHDFGKVGVREHVLVKAKKLYPYELERILDAPGDGAPLRRAGRAPPEGRPPRPQGPGPGRPRRLETTLQGALRDLDRIEEVVLRANEPTVLPEGDFSTLQAIAPGHVPRPPRAPTTPSWSPTRLRVLSIRKGSLSEEERLEIESHVTHTFEFLKQDPVDPRAERACPASPTATTRSSTAAGTPARSPSEAIPIQSRMMTVSDIFDALSASDRPYKKAVPPEKALDILKLEVKDGMLDPDPRGPLHRGQGLREDPGHGGRRAPSVMPIHLITTGGSIDKTYSPLSSSFEVGEPQAPGLLREAGIFGGGRPRRGLPQGQLGPHAGGPRGRGGDRPALSPPQDPHHTRHRHGGR